MINDIHRELKSLERTIEGAKTRKSQGEGSIKTNKKRLLTEFKLKTVDEAKKRTGRLTKQIDRSDKEMVTKFQTLKDNYEW